MVPATSWTVLPRFCNGQQGHCFVPVVDSAATVLSLWRTAQRLFGPCRQRWNNRSRWVFHEKTALKLARPLPKLRRESLNICCFSFTLFWRKIFQWLPYIHIHIVHIHTYSVMPDIFNQQKARYCCFLYFYSLKKLH